MSWNRHWPRRRGEESREIYAIDHSTMVLDYARAGSLANGITTVVHASLRDISATLTQQVGVYYFTEICCR